MLGRDCRRFLETHLNPSLPSKKPTLLSFHKISVFDPQKNINLLVSISRIVCVLSTGRLLINPTEVGCRLRLCGELLRNDNFLILSDPDFLNDLKNLEYQDQFVLGRLRFTETLVWLNVNHVDRVEEMDGYHQVYFGKYSRIFNNFEDQNESPVMLELLDLSAYQIKLMNDPEKWEEIRLE
jgi:hypothetical protein